MATPQQQPIHKRSMRLLILLIAVVLVIVLFWGITIVSKDTRTTGDKKTFKPVNSTRSILDASELATPDDPFTGSEAATVTIVEFSDFQCPFCADAAEVMNQVKEQYGDQIHYVYRDFPLPDHKYATIAAQAAQCANDQGKFWEYHDVLFANQDRLTPIDLKKYAFELGLDGITFNDCFDTDKYSAEVAADFKAGVNAGVEATPTFYINNSKVDRVPTLEEMQRLIDSKF